MRRSLRPQTQRVTTATARMDTTGGGHVAVRIASIHNSANTPRAIHCRRARTMFTAISISAHLPSIVLSFQAVLTIAARVFEEE